MARKATEVKKKKKRQRICIVSFQWGNMILNEHFLVKTSDGLCLQMNTYCAFRKQAENFYLEIFVSTQVGGRERCELRFCQTWQQRVWLRRRCNVHICIMYCICVCIMYCILCILYMSIYEVRCARCNTVVRLSLYGKVSQSNIQ